MARIWIRQTGKSISCQEGANLLDALLEGRAFVIIPAAARESAANVKCGSARGNCLPCLRRSGRF